MEMFVITGVVDYGNGDVLRGDVLGLASTPDQAETIVHEYARKNLVSLRRGDDIGNGRIAYSIKWKCDANYPYHGFLVTRAEVDAPISMRGAEGE